MSLSILLKYGLSRFNCIPQAIAERAVWVAAEVSNMEGGGIVTFLPTDGGT
jgi:hypothetical protein